MVRIPQSLKSEHEDLARHLSLAASAGGGIADAAARVSDHLTVRFAHEEQVALLPLGVLVDLAKGQSVAQASEIIRAAQELKDQLPELMAEHLSIMKALDQLASAAEEAGDLPSMALAAKLKRYAQLKDEVLYPAAVLVGEFLKRCDTPRTTPARWPLSLGG